MWSDIWCGATTSKKLLYMEIKSSCMFRSSFATTFPICISGIILSVISIDRYINIFHNRFYTRIVNKTFMITAIVCMIIISFVMAKFAAEYRENYRQKSGNSCYCFLSLHKNNYINWCCFKSCSIKKIKQKTQNSSKQEFLDPSLTKKNSDDYIFIDSCLFTINGKFKYRCIWIY